MPVIPLDLKIYNYIDAYLKDNGKLPEVWMCVGTNVGQSDATWFYIFVNHDDAVEFQHRAMNHTDKVTWDVCPYPCPINDADSAFDAFSKALNEP